MVFKCNRELLAVTQVWHCKARLPLLQAAWVNVWPSTSSEDQLAHRHLQEMTGVSYAR
jgi:hypothetical protein